MSGAGNVGEYAKLSLGGKVYTFRALDLDQIEELEPQFVAVTAGVGSDDMIPKVMMQAVAEIAAASLKAKHPDVDVAACRKLITLGTMGVVMEAVRGVSQLVPVGEAPAGSP